MTRICTLHSGIPAGVIPLSWSKSDFLGPVRWQTCQVADLSGGICENPFSYLSLNMVVKKYLGVVLGILGVLSINAQSTQTFSEIAVFENGKDGYACYRIPATIKANDNSILFFAEGRKYGCNDFGDVDIVMKKWTGGTLSEQKLIVDAGLFQAGNPAPVLDMMDPNYPQGRIFLFYNTGTASEHATRQGKGLREVLFITSTDHGSTWSSPTNITSSVHFPNRPDIKEEYNSLKDWRSYANTPGHALQIQNGPNAGRLFIPANHSEGEPQDGFLDYRAHAFYSDDHGLTWVLSPTIDVASGNESIAVELPAGGIMQNIRQQSGEKRQRLVAISETSGESWDEIYFDSTLISPVCQASMINYRTDAGDEVILFSNPASAERREKMTVRVSYDNGRTWILSRQIRSGESAYSDLVILSDNTIGLLYELGNDHGIHFAHFNYSWLTQDKNQSDNPWIRKILKKGYAGHFDFQMAPPGIEYDQAFFEKSLQVKLKMNYPGVKIFYSLDGSMPDENSRLYSNELIVDQSAILKTRAFHPTAKPSIVAEAEFLRLPESPELKNVKLKNTPNKDYPGHGTSTLLNRRKGSLNFRDGEWLGFAGDDLVLEVQLARKQSIDAVSISYLSDAPSWIFQPKSIQVLHSKKGEDFEIVSQFEFPAQEETDKSGSCVQTLEFSPLIGGSIRVVVKNQGLIPIWHPGKGTPAWLFVDEILFHSK